MASIAAHSAVVKSICTTGEIVASTWKTPHDASVQNLLASETNAAT